MPGRNGIDGPNGLTRRAGASTMSDRLSPVHHNSVGNPACQARAAVYPERVPPPSRLWQRSSDRPVSGRWAASTWACAAIAESTRGPRAIGPGRALRHPVGPGVTPERMQAIRLRLKLTQEGMARLLRLAPSGWMTVRSWESGRRTPSGPITLIYEALEDGRIAPPRNDGGRLPPSGQSD